MKPTHAPYLTSRANLRPYGLVSPQQVRELRMDGDVWITRRCGIVVYINESYPETDASRIHLVPRNLTLERVPGSFAPPQSFERTGARGEWHAMDWLHGPRSMKGDPKLACLMFLRRNFFKIEYGQRSKRKRAMDIWPQPGQKSLIWPWEPRRFKRG